MLGIKKIPKTWKNFYGFSVPRKSEIFAVSLSPQQADGKRFALEYHLFKFARANRFGVFTAKFFAFNDRYFQSPRKNRTFFQGPKIQWIFRFKICRSKLQSIDSDLEINILLENFTVLSRYLLHLSVLLYSA